jgi:hypothetical protein
VGSQGVVGSNVGDIEGGGGGGEYESSGDKGANEG